MYKPSPPSSRCSAQGSFLQGTRRSFDPRRQTQWAKSSCQTSCNFPPSSAPLLEKKRVKPKKPSWDTFFHGKSFFCFFFTGSEHVMVCERITTWYFYIFFYHVLNLEVLVELGNTTIVSPPSVWVTLGPISMENIFVQHKVWEVEQ